MMMTHFDESADETINEVARAMTAAPAPALRARVVARLGPRRSRGASWLVPATVTLVTATVAVLLVTRRVMLRPVTTAPPAVAASAALQHPIIARAPSPEFRTPDAHRPAIARVDATTNTDSAAAAWRANAFPALEAAPDLKMAAIQPTALPIAQLEVAPIEQAPPLVVKAIGSDR